MLVASEYLSCMDNMNVADTQDELNVFFFRRSTRWRQRAAEVFFRARVDLLKFDDAGGQNPFLGYLLMYGEGSEFKR